MLESIFPRRNHQVTGSKGRVDKSRRLKLLWSYLPDWIITIGLWAVFYALDKINGWARKTVGTVTTLQLITPLHAATEDSSPSQTRRCSTHSQSMKGFRCVLA